MSIKLNGWQRIWIIIGILLFIFASSVFLFNTEKRDIYRHWENETIELTFTLERFKNYDVWWFRRSYPDLTNQEIIEKIQNKFTGPPHNLNFNSINNNYKPKLGGLPKRQIKTASIIYGL
jgi:hypothetical protein